MPDKKRDKQGLTEEEFLASYHAGNYVRPSVAADMAIFAITEEKKKKLPEIIGKEFKYFAYPAGRPSLPWLLGPSRRLRPPG